MLKELSLKQKRVFDFYKKFFTENWIMPTYQVASEKIGIQPSVIYNHVANLEKIGYLHKDGNGNIKLESKLMFLPVLWSIACGEPIDIFEEKEQDIEVPNSMIWSGNNGYILKAKWESMKEVGILDGDFLIIKYQNDVDDWDIWVVVDNSDFDEKATLKQIFHTEKWLLCKPKNKVFESFVLKESEIRGKLVWVIKHFN